MRFYCSISIFLLLRITDVEMTRLCRDDYKHVDGLGFYKLHTRAIPWNDARNLCRQEGAELAILNSKAEELALRDILKNGSALITDAQWKEQVHLGIHDMFREGEWVTLCGEPLNSTGYQEWSSTWFGHPQPDNSMDNQHCGSLLMEGGMDDFFCKGSLAFICEIPLHSCGNDLTVSAF